MLWRLIRSLSLAGLNLTIFANSLRDNASMLSRTNWTISGVSFDSVPDIAALCAFEGLYLAGFT
jgi:hypothetical protein